MSNLVASYQSGHFNSYHFLRFLGFSWRFYQERLCVTRPSFLGQELKTLNNFKEQQSAMYWPFQTKWLEKHSGDCSCVERNAAFTSFSTVCGVRKENWKLGNFDLFFDNVGSWSVFSFYSTDRPRYSHNMLHYLMLIYSPFWMQIEAVSMKPVTNCVHLPI